MLCLSASPRGRYSTSTYKPNTNSRPPTRTLNTHKHASSTHTNTHTAHKQHFANTTTPNTNMHHTQTRTTFASVCVLRGFCHLSMFGATRIPMPFVDLLRSCQSASSVMRACAVRAGVVPSSLPCARMSHLLSADSLFRNHFASQRGESRLCIIPLDAAV